MRVGLHGDKDLITSFTLSQRQLAIGQASVHTISTSDSIFSTHVHIYIQYIWSSRAETVFYLHSTE